ncbi:glycosyltransferase family 4 protein [Intrasporangium calvum]|uniref:Glycosyltransferase family 4 protein n=1 Tax=Intrasporangium calvum TaxID=53358 RepID=A0ABT5GHE0_9MICO|nr:glycosyltransferase family 1 protein [Intrasporangium calvum]MDC5697679.1 glycosyltransferase family 4 protein [Intrasporangium calvum]
MGVGLNGKWLSQPITGTQRYAGEIARRVIPQLDGPVTLHLPRDAEAPAWLPPSVTVRRSPLRGTIFEQLWLPWAARRDLLVSLGGPAPLAAPRQIVTMHDASPFRFPDTYSRLFGTWYRFMYRVLAHRAAAILTVSEFSASELAEVLGVARNRFVVAGNGSDHVDGIKPVRPLLDGLDADFVLCVGTFAKHKNLADTLTALESQSVRTIVVGASGSDRVFHAERRQDWQHATFAGRLSDGEIVWLYDHARCLVFPSRYEGFGLPIVEAQRRGCPVVALAAASVPEVAGDGAELVAATEELPAAVRDVLGDPARRDELRAAGRANAGRRRWRGSAETVARLILRIRTAQG